MSYLKIKPYNLMLYNKYLTILYIIKNTTNQISLTLKMSTTTTYLQELASQAA